MTDETLDPDAVIDAMARLLDVPIEESYRPGIKAHLEAAHKLAQPVLALELDDEAEPAPVYVA